MSWESSFDKALRWGTIWNKSFKTKTCLDCCITFSTVIPPPPPHPPPPHTHTEQRKSYSFKCHFVFSNNKNVIEVLVSVHSHHWPALATCTLTSYLNYPTLTQLPAQSLFFCLPQPRTSLLLKYLPHCQALPPVYIAPSCFHWPALSTLIFFFFHHTEDYVTVWGCAAVKQF